MPESYHSWADNELIKDHEANPGSFREPLFIIKPNKNMNTTEETETITSEDVAEWMRQQLIKVHVNHDYATLSIEITGFRKSIDPSAVFRVYVGDAQPACEGFTFERCFSDLAKCTPITIAEGKRRQAAILIAEADKLEGSAA